MITIACIGECMVELSERQDGLLQRGFGGDTLNTAIYLARHGIDVSYVTALGQDQFSNEMVRAWQEEGINTDLVLRSEHSLPGLYLIQTSPEGERRFSYWRDSAPVRRLFTHAETPRVERLLRAHDQIYLSGITLSLFDEPSRARLFAILDDCRAAGRQVVFDTNFRPRGWPDRDAAIAAYRAILKRADLVLASTEDLELLDPTTDPRSTLNTATATEIVLKLPDASCLVLHADTETHVPALHVETVLDTTAAGDSFAAAYIAARAAGHAPAEAARHGHALAAQVIQHRGALMPRQTSCGALPHPPPGGRAPRPAPIRNPAMLRTIDPLLTPDLLHALAAMGHGDTIALVDANFPAAGKSRRLIQLPGITVTETARAVLTLLPLDTFVRSPAQTMQVVDDPTASPPVFLELSQLVTATGAPAPEPIDRFRFYAEAEAAFAIVHTGERRLYGNIILRKGVIE